MKKIELGTLNTQGTADMYCTVKKELEIAC